MARKAPTDISKQERQKAKAVNFGFIFGMGAKTFVEYARDSYGVSMTPREAETFKRRYLELYPGIAHWQREMARKMPQEVRSLGDRLRYFPDRSSDYCSRLNASAQGTEADGLKKSLILLREPLKKLGARAILSVHDELIIEGPEKNGEEIIHCQKNLMKAGMEQFLSEIPVKVEADIRKSWTE